jgi:hypothetical protein
MRNRIFAIAAAIVTLTASPSIAEAQTQDWPGTPRPCSDQTITGTYLFTVHGKILTATTPPEVVVWLDGVGTITFDGNGGLAQQDFVVHNAVPPNNSSTNGFGQGETGTYTVFADCTGNAQIISASSTLTLALVVSPKGTIHAVVSSATMGGNPALAQTYSDFEKISNATSR